MSKLGKRMRLPKTDYDFIGEIGWPEENFYQKSQIDGFGVQTL
jgi:hypothetical protein